MIALLVEVMQIVKCRQVFHSRASLFHLRNTSQPPAGDAACMGEKLWRRDARTALGGRNVFVAHSRTCFRGSLKLDAPRCRLSTRKWDEVTC